MKLIVSAASAAVLAAAVPAIAAAQTAGPTQGAYGTIGYADTHGGGVDLGTIQGRLGWRFNPWLGAEGELAGGVKDDDVSAHIDGVRVTGKAKIEHQEAIYGVGFLPLNPNWEVLGRVGFGHTEGKVSDVRVATPGGGEVTGFSASEAGDSWNFGVGAQYHWDGKNGIRADYTREEFTGSGSDHGDVWSIAYSRKF